MRDERPGPLQGCVKIIDAKKKDEAVAGRRFRTSQCRMIVRAPRMQAEQDRSIGIQQLTKVVMVRRRLRLAKERLVPIAASRHVAYADDCPYAFHKIYRYHARAERRARIINQIFHAMKSAT